MLDPQNWKHAWVIGDTTVYLSERHHDRHFHAPYRQSHWCREFHTIDYLTLPSGSAIVVGTDVGAYIMNNASPGNWKTLGDNLPHAPVFASRFDADHQVLIVSTVGRGAWLYDCKPTKATGQYGETFQAYVSGDDLPRWSGRAVFESSRDRTDNG